MRRLTFKLPCAEFIVHLIVAWLINFPVRNSNSQACPPMVYAERVSPSSLNRTRENKVLGSGFSALQTIFPFGVTQYRLESLRGNPSGLSNTTTPRNVWMVLSIFVCRG